MSKKYDTDDDIRLGRKLFRLMQQDKMDKGKSKLANNIAVFILASVVILGLIYYALTLLGGPK